MNRTFARRIDLDRPLCGAGALDVDDPRTKNLLAGGVGIFCGLLMVGSGFSMRHPDQRRTLFALGAIGTAMGSYITYENY